MIKDYYRRITELLPIRSSKKSKKGSIIGSRTSQILLVVLASASVFLIVIACFVYIRFSAIEDQRLRVEDNLSYWEAVVKQYPNSTDGYYNAGVYAAELGDKNKAVEYLRQAQLLDPSFEKAKLLEEELVK